MAAREIPSLPGAEFFVFSKAASVSCIVIGGRVICIVCVLGSEKLMEMSFAVLSVWRSSRARRACFSVGSESEILEDGSVRGGEGNWVVDLCHFIISKISLLLEAWSIFDSQYLRLACRTAHLSWDFRGVSCSRQACETVEVRNWWRTSARACQYFLAACWHASSH